MNNIILIRTKNHQTLTKILGDKKMLAKILEEQTQQLMQEENIQLIRKEEK